MMLPTDLLKRTKYLLMFSDTCCGRKKRTNSTVLIVAAMVAVMTLPVGASAQVVLSEIMYDAPGTEGSGDHDWVEVFNAGPSDVDLSTYRFFEAGTNHTLKVVQGAATLPVGGYAVIANIPDTFKLDWPSYTGALFDSSFNLNSTGESIGIRAGDLSDSDAPFTYVPQDAATNNGSSLQRTSVSGASFTSSSPTPGTGSLVSSGGGDSSSSSTTSNATTATQSITSENTSGDYIMPPPPKVFADGGSDRTVVVGADTEFKARAYNEKKDLIGFAAFHWNFGDGSTAQSAVVSHHFDYPGRYVVVLDIPAEKDSVSDQIIITVEPMKLALSLMQDGGVAIENRAGRTLDLSRWIVRSLGQTFTVPDRTFILANATLRISQKTLGFTSGPDMELDYPGGAFALGTVPPPPAATSTPAPVAQPEYGNQTPVVREEQVVMQAVVNDDESASGEPEASVYASSTQVASAGVAGGPSRMWWFGAFGIAGLAAGSLVIARRYGKKEWDIEEMEETR